MAQRLQIRGLARWYIEYRIGDITIASESSDNAENLRYVVDSTMRISAVGPIIPQSIRTIYKLTIKKFLPSQKFYLPFCLSDNGAIKAGSRLDEIYDL